MTARHSFVTTGRRRAPLQRDQVLAQVQLLQLAQVQGLQVQAFVVADMVCSSSEVVDLRLTTRTYRSPTPSS